MGQTAEPEENKENIEIPDSASTETGNDTTQAETEADKADEPAASAGTDESDAPAAEAGTNEADAPAAVAETDEADAPAASAETDESDTPAASAVIDETFVDNEDDEYFEEDDDEDYEEDEDDEDDGEEAESLKAWLLFLLVSAVIAGVVCGLSFGCTVKKVYVSGNSLYTSEEIAEQVISDDSFLRHNTVFLTALYMTPFAPQIPFEESVKVSLESYDAIRITVKDMDIGGFIPYTGRNLYFSPGGIILESSPLVVKNATFVTGISVTEAEKGRKMAADNELGLSMVLEALQTLRKYDMKVDCIALTKAGNIVMYFDLIKVQLGKTDFELKISKISQIYPYLEGRSGTIDMTNYTSADQNIILK